MMSKYDFGAAAGSKQKFSLSASHRDAMAWSWSSSSILIITKIRSSLVARVDVEELV